MLYLIRLPYFLDETGTKLGTVLKFGFTDNYKTRKIQYLSSNLSIIELKQIDGGTLEDETRLKIYFKQEGYVQSRNEWLYDNERTINFFNTYDTIDKIRLFLDSKGIVIVQRNFKIQLVNYRIVSFVIGKLGNTQELWEELIDLLRHLNPKKQVKTICTKYGLSLEELQTYLESSPLFEDPIYQAAQEFNELPNVKDKLKFLVDFWEEQNNQDNSENKEIANKNINNFLDLIPGKYRDYYEKVTPERIRANSFQESEVKKEWRRKLANQSISNKLAEEIYVTFKTGERYPKDEIKQTLKDIYSRTGYTQTAKATDLELYFYLKKVYMTSEKKNGFEIIAKK